MNHTTITRFSCTLLYCGNAGIILCLPPANDRQRYIVMLTPIGWVHTQNDPCNVISFGGLIMIFYH